MNIKVAHEIEGSVAEKPTVILSAVKGNDREYTISCLDNENLHYIVPGGEEQEINYYDAYNEETGTFGSVVVTCTQSGELKAWTTKEDATSEVVTVNVECGVITLPEPAAVIASVEEGFGKTYTVSVDNASVLLSPAVALSWKIDYTDGTSETGSYSGASTSLSLTKAGTAVITVTSIPVEGVYYYGSNSYTLVNDVEYQIALGVALVAVKILAPYCQARSCSLYAEISCQTIGCRTANGLGEVQVARCSLVWHSGRLANLHIALCLSNFDNVTCRGTQHK